MARFCAVVSTAGNWHRLSCKNGSLAPAKQGQSGGSKLDVYEAGILMMIEKSKDISLHEIAGRLEQRHGMRAAHPLFISFLASYPMLHFDLHFSFNQIGSLRVHAALDLTEQ